MMLVQVLRSSILLASILQATQVALASHIGLLTRSEAALSNLLPRAPDNATSGLDYNVTMGSYYINVTLGGRQFSVEIDTGSSDFWVAGTVPNANSTGANAKIQYAVGEDEGPIQTADLTLFGFTVPSQAFIAVTPSNSSPDGYGLIGLGPSSKSVVLNTLNNSAGDPPIDRIFRQNTSTPNFISILLNRPNDTRPTYTGEMTISEVLPLFQNISSQPKIPISNTSQDFSVLLDPDGIIGPDGKAIKTTSNAPLAPSHDPHRLQVIFDSGFSIPQLPKDVVKAIYSGAKGAKLLNISELHGETWIVDCDAELNISFKIGGVTYPIHPLDLSQPEIDDNGKTFCIGAFQPIFPGARDPTLDAILGMRFLTNVYLLVNYGDFIDGSTSNTSNPYVQILSTTDPAQAHADFVATRQGLSNTTDSPNLGGSQSSKMNIFSKYGMPIFTTVAAVSLCIFL